MDKTILVEKNIEEGKKLLEILDSNDFPVKAALWFFLVDSDTWRFIIASPLVEKNGPKETYHLIQSAMLKSSPPTEISLKDISVLSPNNELIRLLKIAVQTGPGISGIRFTRNTINNVFIEDAYIYRLL